MGYRLKRAKMDCGYIPLTRGMVARVSRIDYARVARFNWCVQNARNTFYACRREAGQFILLHNYVLNVDKGLDHRNGNGLDCRRSNLRKATTKENARNRGPQRNNTSGFKGVSKWKPVRGRQGRWQAGIKINGKRIGLGIFETAEEAAAAYDAAARRLHGRFARLNLGGLS